MECTPLKEGPHQKMSLFELLWPEDIWPALKKTFSDAGAHYAMCISLLFGAMLKGRIGILILKTNFVIVKTKFDC